MPLQLVDLQTDHPVLNRDPGPLRTMIERQLHVTAPRLRRCWLYYTNPVRPRSYDDNRGHCDRPYRQAQEWGLPSRLTGCHVGDQPFDTEPAEPQRKEIVVENDIAWRIDTQTDFLFGKPIVLDSTAPDPRRRDEIATLLRLILAQNGGMSFLRELATRTAVFGTTDVAVQFDDKRNLPPLHDPGCDLPLLGQRPEIDLDPDADDQTPDIAALSDIARRIRFNLLDAERMLPLTEPAEPDCLCGMIEVWHQPRPGEPTEPVAVPRGHWVRRLLAALGHDLTTRPIRDDGRPLMLRITTPNGWQLYENERLINSGDNPLSRLPIVRIRNVAIPGGVGGIGEVEPLMPLQDELNVRLSDRANRLTLQSHKMYLGIGIDDFENRAIRPGQMWSTENLDARVQEFGGDAPAPTEAAHIAEIREALDKSSGVSPIAAGAIRGRIGHLTSAAALRVTMLALLARTERKRLTHGTALGQLCELALAHLDAADVFKTEPRERGVRIHWPSPIPADESDALAAAKSKLDLGVDPAVVRREIGY
jgi:hypothetical protein